MDIFSILYFILTGWSTVLTYLEKLKLHDCVSFTKYLICGISEGRLVKTCMFVILPPLLWICLLNVWTVKKYSFFAVIGDFGECRLTRINLDQKNGCEICMLICLTLWWKCWYYIQCKYFCSDSICIFQIRDVYDYVVYEFTSTSFVTLHHSWKVNTVTSRFLDSSLLLDTTVWVWDWRCGLLLACISATNCWLQLHLFLQSITNKCRCIMHCLSSCICLELVFTRNVALTGLLSILCDGYNILKYFCLFLCSVLFCFWRKAVAPQLARCIIVTLRFTASFCVSHKFWVEWLLVEYIMKWYCVVSSFCSIYDDV